MYKFVITGGKRLKGDVEIKGAKNAALPMMAAAILAEGKTVLRNVPDLADVNTMSEILCNLGASVKRVGDTIAIEIKDERSFEAPYQLVSKMRASICVLGPLLAKRKRAKVSLPGGCVIGVRPIDIHIKGLMAMGAKIKIEHGYVIASAPYLKGTEIYLGGPFGSTVTGTENIMMAAVLGNGRTIIENAACEPEVQELALLLNKMGAKIQNIGTHRLVIEGVKKLNGVEYSIIPDRIEAGTFMVASAITGGDVRVKNMRSSHLGAVIDALQNAGFSVDVEENSCRVRGGKRIKPLDLTTLCYPGFPTDMQAQFMALLAIADGISVITEKIYPDRFLHVAEMVRMGANIRKEGNMAIISGVKKLYGAPIMASDLRASAGLVLAGMAAEGITEVGRVYHIDRGYEKIDLRLNQLGAKIERVKYKL